MVSYFARYLRRHLNGLHIAAWGLPPDLSTGRLIVYSNHPAWWDAALYVLAADRFFPDHESYAPIDAEMLRHYGVLSRIGAFGVDLESRKGATQFLTASKEILASENRALWITAQGGFSDVRQRPLGLKPGLGRLMDIAPSATVLPLAIEYSFWSERGAEAFIAFGPPLRAADLSAAPRNERFATLDVALTATLDRLAADVQSRDPAKFRPVLSGKAGIGGVYDGWRRATALLRGRRFDPSHQGRPS
ncbi:lysophospholipid acyltransferase family protein [Microvirga antarctica]|uniref:lysophospholipid acyltransferase family protein n=1 Tax=Microvirga antarctica TaxID=2819233 RepID=UPI001B316A15|nr:lysophospholipid acyltransferase family protein [Microvirga antarctica]